MQACVNGGHGGGGEGEIQRTEARRALDVGGGRGGSFGLSVLAADAAIDTRIVGLGTAEDCIGDDATGGVADDGGCNKAQELLVVDGGSARFHEGEALEVDPQVFVVCHEAGAEVALLILGDAEYEGLVARRIVPDGSETACPDAEGDKGRPVRLVAPP